MRTFIFAMAMAMSWTLSAQDDGYTMYETVYIKPDVKHISTLAKNIKAHNDTYHSEAPYNAIVWRVENGPNVGNMVWMMGPCTYTDLDSRPSGEHDEDWINNVLPYTDGQKHGEYWRRDDDLSIVNPNATGPSPLIRVRFNKFAPGQSHRIDGLMSKIKSTIEAMEGDDNYWSIYYNEFIQGQTIGRHMVTVIGFSGWAELDEEGESFTETFNKVHGPNSYNNWLREMNDVIADTYDEYWKYMPDLSTTME
jgi:hypothetical protein